MQLASHDGQIQSWIILWGKMFMNVLENFSVLSEWTDIPKNNFKVSG